MGVHYKEAGLLYVPHHQIRSFSFAHGSLNVCYARYY